MSVYTFGIQFRSVVRQTPRVRRDAACPAYARGDEYTLVGLLSLQRSYELLDLQSSPDRPIMLAASLREPP